VLSKSSIHASQGCRGEWTAMIVHSEKGANTTIFHSRLYYFPLTLTRVQDKYSFPSPGSVEPWTVMTWDEQDQPLSQRHTLTESRPMHRTHEEPTLRSRYWPLATELIRLMSWIHCTLPEIVFQPAFFEYLSTTKTHLRHRGTRVDVSSTIPNKIWQSAPVDCCWVQLVDRRLVAARSRC
jgi:hypothetical protein